MFRNKNESTVEVYIADIVVKSQENQRQVEDFKEAFEILRQHKLCLNAGKCAFGVRVRKFLGYMITN